MASTDRAPAELPAAVRPPSDAVRADGDPAVGRFCSTGPVAAADATEGTDDE